MRDLARDLGAKSGDLPGSCDGKEFVVGICRQVDCFGCIVCGLGIFVGFFFFNYLSTQMG